ncbi:ribosomal-processing cysteine protease Prp [Levilactobacillus bambusae]|uniref:Ribosomal processing cysteine protease Prp n=1 Tax=Levilactobacillus bambusae TaxID=2024736 RepID=A0A2V1N509_9LACO|nr:ribosomal-processing cysteine protease Prp [Levilactobacillus bambusae]PWG00935.1 ribosomal-processing cysteine protease Prp [Levilactobacillus bambusae]
MIHATFFRNADSQISAFKLTGHADSGDYGHDIVCAAVSVLSISTVNGLQRVAQLDLDVDSNDTEGGYLRVTLLPTNDSTREDRGQTLLQSFEDGLHDVAANYSDYITMTQVSN